MFTRMRGPFAPPAFADEEKTRVAALLNTIALASLALFVTCGFISLIFHPNPLPLVVIAGMMALLAVGTLLLMHRGYVRLAGLLLPSAIWAISTITMFHFGGVRLPIRPDIMQKNCEFAR